MNHDFEVFSRLLWNSLLVAGLGTVCAALLGLAGALAVLGLNRALRQCAIAAAVIVLVLPPFLVTNCWLHFLGLTGPWRPWWPFDIYSHAGVIWIFALTFWPISFLLCLASWEKLDSTMFEVEPALRGGNLVRWLLWPSTRSAMLQAALITFAMQMNQFSVPAILQVRVLPAELWLRLSTHLDLGGALQVSLPSILVTLLLLALIRGRAIAWPRIRGAMESGSVRKQLGILWPVCSLFAIGTICLSLLLPLGQLGFDPQTWRDFPGVLQAAPVLISWSLAFAGACACLAVMLALFTWKHLAVGRIAWLLFITPGVLLGASLPYLLPSAAAVVVVALALRYFALPWQGTRLAIRHADTHLIDVIRLDSASHWDLLRHGYWPQIRPVLGAAAYLCYVLALWDVETLVLIYPPGGETLAIRVFNLLHYGHIGQVNALCLILLLLALAPGAMWILGRWIVRCKG